MNLWNHTAADWMTNLVNDACGHSHASTGRNSRKQPQHQPEPKRELNPLFFFSLAAFRWWHCQPAFSGVRDSPCWRPFTPLQNGLVQRLPKISITYSPFESNNSRLGGYCLKCLKYDSLYDERGCFLPLSDQDLYDFIEPNPDEDPALSECDGQQSTVSCIKVNIFFLFQTWQKVSEKWKSSCG